jgi:3'-phosphoadenosine 5'-phosphosulfate sulfotransferase (PAPS reductase)/FAD synthetase
MSKIIVALSGGKASAWCANWALENFSKDDVVLYFNDTKWEHPDLYRFLNDLEVYFDHKIINDSLGLSPEDLFYQERALANNRMPFCSKILKAKRLQKYRKNGDLIIFGIGKDEIDRANRIIEVYQKITKNSLIWKSLLFPLISESVDSEEVDRWLNSIRIKEPLLYQLGFSHNNCSGGCVRAGKKQWKMLYEKLPGVYLERERVEREVREYLKKDVHFFKDETLEHFRERVERGELSSHYTRNEDSVECVGVCDTQS